jgi:hypothetical protein
MIRGMRSFLSPDPAGMPSEQLKNVRTYVDELDLVMEDASEIAFEAMEILRDIREELRKIA